MGIPITKIRQSHDRPISVTKILTGLQGPSQYWDGAQYADIHLNGYN